MFLSDKMAGALKAVAIFEACKGLLVLCAGLALFSLIHQDIQSISEQLVGQLHLNPAKHFPRILIKAAGGLTDGNIRFLALLAVLYASMRFIEAYGLWFARRWAEWFALVSGSVYLPIELYKLTRGVSWLKIILIVTNLLIVVCMAFMLKKGKEPFLSKEGSHH